MTRKQFLKKYCAECTAESGPCMYPDQNALRQIARSVEKCFKGTEYPELARCVAKVLWFFDRACIAKNHIEMVCEMVILHKNKVSC